jgi:hypothetical protein
MLLTKPQGALYYYAPNLLRVVHAISNPFFLLLSFIIPVTICFRRWDANGIQPVILCCDAVKKKNAAHLSLGCELNSWPAPYRPPKEYHLGRHNVLFLHIIKAFSY